MPIGNFTSQWFGNLYLNELDMRVKHSYKIKAYLRYCDDFIFLGNNKRYLRWISKDVEEFLYSHLKLKMSKNNLFKTSQGIDFLGYRHFPNHYLKLRKSTMKRFKRKINHIKAMLNNNEVFDYDYMLSSMISYDGWLSHANTYHLKESLELADIIKQLKRKRLYAKANSCFNHTNYFE